MTTVNLAPFFRFHTNAVADCVFNKRRYLYDEIDWNEKAIMVIGDRGVGKTTLLMQYATSKFKNLDTKKLITASELFTNIYTKNDLVLQTCISQSGESSWGRLFVLAKKVSTLDK